MAAPTERAMALQGIMPEVFHANELEVLVEGPAGTGKTWTDHLRTIALCQLAPGSQHLYTRQVRADMTETVLKSFEEALGDDNPIVVNGPGRGHREAYEFPNGSRVVVAGLDRPERTYSGEYDTVTIFEGSDVPFDSYQRLKRTLRGGTALAFKQIRVECNPEAPSHWINRHFGDRPGMRRFRTTHTDNPYLWDAARGAWTKEGHRYVVQTLGSLTGHQRARLLLGQWVGVEGVIYDEWSESVHVVNRLPPGAEGWWRIRAIDFGFKEPFVCLWAVVDPDGRIYVEREYVKCEQTVNAHAREIRRLTPDEGLIQQTVADHDAEDRATLREGEIYTVPAIKPKRNSDWPAAFEPIKRRLQLAEDGFPRLFVLRDALERGGGREAKLGTKPCGIIEEITAYQWEEPKPDRPSKERPRQVNDHSMDALRYLVLAVDRYFDPGADKPTERYAEGSVGEALGLDDDDGV